MPRAHSWTLLWQPKHRCSDTHTQTDESGATFWVWSLYVWWASLWDRLRWDDSWSRYHPLEVQRWKSKEGTWRRCGQKRMKPKSLSTSPPGSTPWVTRLVLTFGIHQVHHNILLALVKRELAWEVEAFFSLYFDRLLVSEWMKNEGGGKGWGPWKGKKTKTEWDSMKAMDNHAEQWCKKQMELNKTIHF